MSTIAGRPIPDRLRHPVRRVITVHSFAFAPGRDTVAVGDTLIVRNRDIVPHTFTAPRFDSGTIAADSEWRVVLRRPGVVSYHCRFHPTMSGTLVVR